LRRFRKRTVILVVSAILILGFIALNLIAYMQARSMTHFVEGGIRTSHVESLTLTEKLKILFVGVNIPKPINASTPADVGLPFQTFRFGGQDHSDCEGWFVRAKNPKAFCLAFHAYATCKSSLLAPARIFHDMGYDVILVDFRGSGGSRGSDTSHGYYEAEDVAAAVDFASHQCPGEPQFLYGQSMGGAAIIRAIADLHVHPSGAIVESCYDRMLAITENRFHAMGLPAFPLARLVVFWGGHRLGYNAFALNPADFATRVHCPVLMMQGSLDRRVTDDEAKNLFDHLAGPRQFELYDQTGHCGFLQSDPDRWKNSIAQFLANCQIAKAAS
jgi:alpha-beta hydrolase superfamily lysophospholipase